MAKYIKRNLANPTNQCEVDFKTPPEDLRVGSVCERTTTGNVPLTAPTNPDTDGDGYYQFISEGAEPVAKTEEVDCGTADHTGYHKTSVSDIFRGTTASGACPSPYSRYGLGGKGFNDVVRDREEQLLLATGRAVVLLRRQHTGRRCLCFESTRGRSRKACEICYGVSFAPGYIPYVNQKDPLGRILIRTEPFAEALPQKEQGLFQEITISAWGLSAPLLRQRDVIIVYRSDGTEELRYEIKEVTRNSLFGAASGNASGAQKFQMLRIDPTQSIYNLDPFRIPDLADITIDLSDITELADPSMKQEQLGVEDDGFFTNIQIESIYGDGAFSGLMAEGYKLGYETNYRRALAFKEPMYAPDFNAEDGTVDDGYGPVFTSTTGQIIRFSTPQVIQSNAGVNPLEVLAAEKKKYFVNGFISGGKHGWLDGQSELRARGQL